jgi:hypothetical protein
MSFRSCGKQFKTLREAVLYAAKYGVFMTKKNYRLQKEK